MNRPDPSRPSQHVHCLLQLAPMVSASFVSVLHWPQLLALYGIGPDRPDWSIRWKSDPLPTGYTATMLAAQIVLKWLPYLVEFARTLVATREPAAKLGRQSVLP